MIFRVAVGDDGPNMRASGPWSGSGSGREPSRHPARRFRDLIGIAGEANAQMALAAGTEGAAGRGADSGFVDELERERLESEKPSIEKNR